MTRIGAQRPRLSLLPDGVVSSAADEAIDLAASCGLVLDDWQRWVLDGILSERADRSFAAAQAVLIVPRQSGKNAVLEALELAALFLLNESRIIHTAHLAKTAADHMQRMVALIRGNPELEAMSQFFFANGKEAIVRRDNHARLEFITRGRKTARGGSPQRVIFDEALYLSDEQMQAIMPALSAQSLNTETSPQIIYTSSAPLPESDVLHRVRNACIAGELKNAFFAEWSCPPGTDPADRDAWYQANPGLGIRIGEQWIAEQELPILSPEAFAIERLGIVLGADGGSSELPNWGRCLDADSQPAGKVSLAVDAAPDLSWVSIAVAGDRTDGLAHVEVVERCTSVTDAVVILKAMWTKHRMPVHLDPRAAASALIPPLMDARIKVVELTTADLLKACALVKQQVHDGLVRHRGQIPLDQAVQGAAVRAIGEGWAWARKVSTVDITPLMAVTLALHAARNDRPRADAWLAWE